ncbi:phosphatase PAP2 family protein [Actinomadura sp. KC345]|uniref:phosphatase PAP2 family protein n=1 Tax=Actinomadura sp. KC345 TaxID=2530371 RepID=UPI0014055B76|nr:phosphatase PAP2 family protein [Actinomadura sp. KC345]
MLTGFWDVVSFLGSSAFYVPVILVVFWCVAPRQAARAAVILLFGAFVNTFLKLLFHDPRPYWTDPTIEGEQPHSSFGMPSGHAQNAPVAWGFWAAQTRRRSLWAAAAVIVALIGVSRVFLGVHSIGQVLAGWGIGLTFLVVALYAEPFIVSWWTRHHLAVQMTLALVVSLVLLGAAWVALQPIEDWRWPSAWARAIRASGGETDSVDLIESSMAAGGFFGVLAGLSLLAARGWFDPGGTPWRRLARVPVALAGAAVVYLPVLLLDGTGLLQAFIVQAVLGFWVTAGAPESFVRLRLAARPTRAVTRPGDERSELRQ